MSTPFPVQVGTNYKDTIVVVDKTTGAGVTGLTQASFTFKLSQGTTGNVATTGITLTEVSAANNPGAYDIVASGATSFTSTTAGKYNLVIHRTSDETYKYEQTILVTANGDFDGSSGAARFTATAADGRITDGTNPLTGVTVRIVNSANTIIAQATSDASGLWGPVFLDATATIYAQKSGYSLGSGTITVVGSTATGPLADIALSTVTGGGTILNSDLTAYARVQARNVAGSQSDTVLQQIVNNALAWVSTAKHWEYYKTHGDVALEASYSTGTIALTNASTTVTLTTGTWPSWAAVGKLKIGNKIYRIATRSSGSVVLLATAWQAAADPLATYVIFKDEYALPTDCLKLGSVFPGPTWGWAGEPTTLENVLQAYNGISYGQAYPDQFAVLGSGGTSKMILYPYPTTANLLPFWYYRKPASLVNSNDTADMDPLHLELVQRAIDYQTAIRYEGCVAGAPEVCLKRLGEAFDRFKDNDKGPVNPSGPLGNTRQRGPIMRLSG